MEDKNTEIMELNKKIQVGLLLHMFPHWLIFIYVIYFTSK